MKPHLKTVIRLTLCIAALWAVAAQVTLDDKVVLRDRETTVAGAVSSRAGGLTVQLPDGTLQPVPADQIARDDHGQMRVSYGLKSTWRNSGKLWLLAGIAVFMAVPLMQGVRLRRVLRSERIEMGLWDSIRLAFAGNFLNFAAPFGSTAGDVYKAWYAARLTPRRTEAATLVFIDRLIGLVTLLLTVGLISVITPAAGPLGVLRPWLAGMIGAGAVAAALWASPLRRLGAIRRLGRRLPLREQLGRIDATARRLMSDRAALPVATGQTLILQTCAAAAFACVAVGLGMHVGLLNAWEVYAGFSAGEIVKALPGPPQGLGTMELAYGYLFAGMGGASQIVSAALAIRLVNLLCSLPGVAMLATGTARADMGEPVKAAGQPA